MTNAELVALIRAIAREEIEAEKARQRQAAIKKIQDDEDFHDSIMQDIMGSHGQG